MTEDFKRKLTAILSADVVGYSRLMGDDEAATVKTLETYKGVMSSLIKQHRGRVVDSPGDNLLAEFGSVVDAVQCAVSIQKELQTRNVDLPENRRMDFRIGINLGDVIEEEDRIYGDGVNIAARLEALADPGGICISKTAFDYIENKLPFGYSFIGEQTVKNIAKPIGAYKVLMETRLVDEEDEKVKAPFWKRKTVLSLGIVVVLAMASVFYLKFYHLAPSFEPVIKSEQETVVTDIKEEPKTIAVIPFVNRSSEENQEAFVDGLSDEIITRLSHISELQVTSSTTSFAFKNSDKRIQEIAEILEREYILEGSVRKVGNSLRISTQLIRASDDYQIWSETYNKEFNVKEILEIQEDIASSVAGKLELTLEAFQLLGGTENIEAYELFLLSKGQRFNPTYSNFGTALESLDSAIKLDPEFAHAWIKKADNHILRIITGPTKYAANEEISAIKAAQTAIEIEPRLGNAYFSLGAVNEIRHDFIKAELAIQKGMSLTSELLTDNDNFFGSFYNTVGKFNMAKGVLEEILQNDPLNKGSRGFYILNFALRGDIKGAEEEYQHCRNIFGDWIWHNRVMTIIRLGFSNDLDLDKIVLSDPIFDRVKKQLDSPAEGLALLRQMYADADNISYHDSISIIALVAFFGDPELAMNYIENTRNMGLWIWLPVFREVRQLPQFKEYVKGIGLLEYWKEFGWPDSNICHPVGDDDFECD
ncbi:adenylate/guanylate cyclase domain-containing protein [Thermodesulfobacteriota bacterium]